MQLRISLNRSDTICAISSPSGMGAIALVRISGGECHKYFGESVLPFKRRRQKKFLSHTVHYGKFVAGDEVVDSLLIVFLAPHSFTGEDMVEISCTGSLYIQKHGSWRRC